MKIIVIGGGPAGKTAAVEAAQIGEEVILIEKDNLGGKCLNEGCMVVSGLNDVAKFFKDSQRFRELGITKHTVEVDFAKVAEGIKETVRKIRTIHEAEAKEAGVEVLKGTAEVKDDKVIFNGEELTFDRLIIATGADANIPPVKGFESAKTYHDLLEFKQTPEKLIIVGSGVIAAEFASIFSILGSEVHVLCRSQFLKMLDPDVKSYVVKKLLDEVDIQENVQVKEINKDGLITSNGHLTGDVIFATGMKPNSGIVKDTVDLGSRGEILVDKQMQTSRQNIYAVGDVVDGIGTTPVARMEGVVAARNACGIHAEADYSIVPGSISLYYDVAFINQNLDKSGDYSAIRDDSAIQSSLPGFAGPGSFWHVLERNTGFTKIKVDSESGAIMDISSISPSARTSIPYMVQMMRDDYKSHDFDDFIETHPSTDPVYKLLRLFSKFG